MMARDAVRAVYVLRSASDGMLVALSSDSRYLANITINWHVDIHYFTYMILQRTGTQKAGRTFELEKVLRTSSSQSFPKASLGPETQTGPAEVQPQYISSSGLSSLRRRQHSPPAIRPSLSTRHSRPHPSIVMPDRQEPPLLSERRRWLLLPLRLPRVRLLHVRVPPG